MAAHDHELIRRLHEAIQRSLRARLDKDDLIERLRAENARLRREADALREAGGGAASALHNGNALRMRNPDQPRNNGLIRPDR